MAETSTDPTDTDREYTGSTLDRLRERGYSPDDGSFGAVIRAVDARLNTQRMLQQLHPDRPPSDRSPTPDDLLDALSLFAMYREQTNDMESRIIDAAREAGASWERIGLVLGYARDGARQGANQRRKKLRDERPMTAVARAARVLWLLDRGFKARLDGDLDAERNALVQARTVDAALVTETLDGIAGGSIPDIECDPRGWNRYYLAAQERESGLRPSAVDHG